MENRIKKIIKKIINKKKNYLSNENLISNGVLDSFNILVLITELEKEFKIKIPLEKFDINSLNTIAKISNYIKNKNKS